MRFIFLLCINISLFAKVDINLSERTIANAQTILVKLQADMNEPKIDKIYAAYEGKRYPFWKNPFQTGRAFYALVPVSYYTKPKKSRLVVVYIQHGKKQYRSFITKIVAGDYKKEKLHVAPSRAKISPKNRRRIAKEQKEAMRIYRSSTPKLFISSPLRYPMDSKITSRFGNKRLFNGVLKSYHSGTDFRAKVGTPIRAVADGRVVLAKNRFFAGNSIILDHGEGIYTGYYHLSRFKVKPGTYVKAGDIIGLAGATGRVTGPHLHFSVRVNGVQVDPMQFIDTFNLLL
jgi:murein DD-endopeptidase MepM/ murein hydrolase activator NlpD